MEPIESVRDPAASRLGHERLEANDFLDHPVGLAVAKGGEGGGNEAATGMATRRAVRQDEGCEPEPDREK